MDWRAFASAFGLVFLAELGDKTQIATMLLAAKTETPFTVFLGAALALVINVSIAVVLGTAIMRIVPQDYIRYGAGALFLVHGVLILVGQ